jgi:hypothetical protein
MNKKHHKVLGRSDSVSLGRSKVFCECIYYCVWTCDCQVAVNVDALAPNMNVAHGTQEDVNIKKLYVVLTLCLCVLYGSQNKQQLLPYKTLRDRFFYNRNGECLQRGTH